MDGLSKQAEEKYLQDVVAIIDHRIAGFSADARSAKKSLGKISDKDLSGQAVEAWKANSAQGQVARLREMRPRPYFGRFDFIEDGTSVVEKIYVGLAQLDDAQIGDYLVYDWRTPMAGLYYSHTVGPADFTAPGGYIRGEITRRREYVIEDARLKAIYDTAAAEAEIAPDEVAGTTDELLQSLLQRNTSGSMHQIVQSIQAEQNQVIRSESEVLAVQGPAGSGKTIIALHRAAYLLYQLRQKRGPNGSVSAKKMVVFSPSEVFSEYISRVLPDLQEEQIRRAVLDRIWVQALTRALSQQKDAQTETPRSFHIESKQAHHELLLQAAGEPSSQLRVLASEIKSSPAMVDVLDRFAEKLEKQAEAMIRDVVTTTVTTKEGQRGQTRHAASQVFVSRDDLLSILHYNAGRVGLLDRMRAVIASLDSRISGYASLAWADRETLSELRTQRQRLQERLQRSQHGGLEGAYAKLWQDASLVKELSGARGGDVARHTLAALEQGKIPFEDVAPMLYLSGLLNGFPSLLEADHVIVDEAQDYSVVDYAYLARCLPRGCTYTIVGDVNQTASAALSIRGFEDLRAVFSRRLQCLELTRGYRSSYEITEFARAILGPDAKVESVRPTGNRPRLIATPAEYPVGPLIEAAVERFRQAGRKLVAVVCKTTAEAQAVHAQLSALGAQLLDRNSKELAEGVFVLPVYLAKGLEFDAVIIPDVSRNAYALEGERKLLYTACTRALHDLELISIGEVSPLIPHLRDVDLEVIEPEPIEPEPIEPEPIVEPDVGVEQAVEAEAVTDVVAPLEPVAVSGDLEAALAQELTAGDDPGHAADAGTTLPPGPPPTNGASEPIRIVLPLATGGGVEIIFPARIPKKEFDRICMMLQLSEPAIVEELS